MTQHLDLDALHAELIETLQGIVNANWRNWKELASAEEFERWAKSRANQAIDRLRKAEAAREGILVWRIAEESHPYPWRFSVTHDGKRHDYAGLPNKCESIDEAYQRATERYRWLLDGTHNERYITPYSTPTDSVDSP